MLIAHMKRINSAWRVLIFFGIIILAISLMVVVDSQLGRGRGGLVTAVIKINGVDYNFLVADTDRARFRGLSDRESMGQYDGMYFIFDRPGIYGMVMRDMRFPIDIAWLDGETIVDLGEEFPLEPGLPEEELTVYSNETPGNGVIEFPAGFLSEHDVMVGDRVEIGSFK